jgi:hypothetical protein
MHNDFALPHFQPCNAYDNLFVCVNLLKKVLQYLGFEKAMFTRWKMLLQSGWKTSPASNSIAKTPSEISEDLHDRCLQCPACIFHPHGLIVHTLHLHPMFAPVCCPLNVPINQSFSIWLPLLGTPSHTLKVWSDTKNQCSQNPAVFAEIQSKPTGFLKWGPSTSIEV